MIKPLRMHRKNQVGWLVTVWSPRSDCEADVKTNKMRWDIMMLGFYGFTRKQEKAETPYIFKLLRKGS